MPEWTNNAIFFILAMTVAVTAIQHILGYLFRAVGLSGPAMFFAPSLG